MKLRVRANAKINLTLAITGKRADGYHNLETVMQSVGLYDTLEIEAAEKISVLCGELSGSTNIAYRAAELFFNTCEISGGADIRIEKRIPQAAGLGGGSADAAAVLCALNRIYDERLSYRQLCEIALKLGADVPFCINGGTALVSGIGEEIKPLSPIEACCFVIAKHGDKPSTAEMYKRVDAVSPSVPDTEAAVSAIENGDFSLLCKCIGNSFSPLWNYSDIKSALKETNPLAVSLSGSGPSVFALYTDSTAAERGAQLLKQRKITAYTAHPVKKGIIFE